VLVDFRGGALDFLSVALAENTDYIGVSRRGIAMGHHEITTRVSNGKIELRDLPFDEGAEVRVVVIPK
jgi:hypothetical protein